MSLPSGYKRLEYIQSSGTQYIDTGFKPNQNTRVVARMSFDARSSTPAVYVFGSANSGSSGMFETSTASNHIRFGYGGSSAEHTFPSNKPFDIDFNKNVIQVDGATYTMNAASFSGSYSMFIFDTNRNKAYRAAPSVTVYSFKIYDNGTLIRDFIPCKNASGVIGLWDDVNSRFYTNAGTGVFTAGPEVAGTHKALINGTAYDAKSGKCLINGTGYAVKKGRTLINGTGYDIALESKTKLADIAVGNTVKIAVDGTMRDWIVVNQGIPGGSPLYDDSCNGTWLLMKETFAWYPWASQPVNSYKTSRVPAYMNDVFLGLLDGNVRGIVKQVKLPWAYGVDTRTIYTGADGLDCKAFLLSACEIGVMPSDHPTMLVDGAQLSYFEGGSGTSAANKRIAYDAYGNAVTWFLRTPVEGSTTYVWNVSQNGQYSSANCEGFGYFRPAMILPFETLVADDGTVLA